MRPLMTVFSDRGDVLAGKRTTKAKKPKLTVSLLRWCWKKLRSQVVGFSVIGQADVRLHSFMRNCISCIQAAGIAWGIQLCGISDVHCIAPCSIVHTHFDATTLIDNT